MTRCIISSFISSLILGVAEMPADVWQQEPGQEQAECNEKNEQTDQWQTCDNPRCPRCRPKSRRRWKRNRFAEQQYQEAGWPGRRGDELSDQLSR